MPFTPFHMGPALLVKAAAQHRFSLLVFGVSQVFIDIEPLVRIIRGDDTLHGFTHTISGAVVIAAAAAVVGRPAANWFLDLLRRESDEPWMARYLSQSLSWTVALTSAAIGTGSHLLLDGIMHADMLPWRPISDATPLLGIVSLRTLHLFCVASGALGVAGILVAVLRASRSSGTGPA